MKLKLARLALAFSAAQLSFGSIIAVGPVPSTGNGIGAVNTILTIASGANATTESGCVAAGAGGVAVTGASACPGDGPNGGTNFTGGDEQTGAPQTQVFSAASLGLTDFNNLQLVFNGSEPVNDNQQGLTITNLAVGLYAANGLLLDVYYLAAADNPYVIADVVQAAGNAGYGFQFDSGQATTANSLLGFNPGLYIGASLNVSDAPGGPEVLQIRTINGGSGGEIPEPAPMALLGIGLSFIGLFRRKLS